MIDVLGLSSKCRSALRLAGIQTVVQLTRLSSSELQLLAGMDGESLQEIHQRLGAMGLGLEPELTEAESSDESVLEQADSRSLESLNLSARSREALREAGISSIDQLLHLQGPEIKHFARFEAESLAELLSLLVHARLHSETAPTTSEVIGDSAPERLQSPDGGASIEVLDLSLRSRNALLNAGVRTVAELSAFSRDQILDIRGVGDKSATDIFRKLKQFKGREPGEPKAMRARHELLRKPLWDWVEEWRSTHSERAQEIIDRRLLARGRRADTLDALGECQGVTRERIRQIERKMAAELNETGHLRELIDEKLHGVRAGRTLPLRFVDLGALDPWFRGSESRVWALDRLLATLGSSHRVGQRSIDGLTFITSKDAADLEACRARFLKQESHLEPRAEQTSDQLEQLERAVCQFAGELAAPEVSSLLLEDLGELLRGPSRPLVAPNPRKIDRVEAILRAADRPLHIDEIVDRLRKAGFIVRPTSVRGAVDRLDKVRVAPSTYTLPEKLARWDPYLDRLAGPVESLMKASPSKQWKPESLLGAMEDGGHLADEELPVHVMRYLLGRMPGVKDLGRDVWCLADAETDSRLPVHELALRILSGNGAPLRLTDLNVEIRRKREMGSAGYLPRWPIVLLGRGLVGLGPQDAGISDERRNLLHQRMLEMCRQGLEIDVEDVLNTWAEITSERWAGDPLVLCRAIEDYHIRVTKSSVGADPAEPTSPGTDAVGSMSPAAKMRAAIQRLEDGCTTEEVLLLAREESGRQFDRIVVRGQLQRAGFMEVDGRWYRSGGGEATV